MVFENLKESIAKFFKAEKYEDAVNEFIKDLQKELVKSDVNLNLAFEITKKIKERAISQEPLLVFQEKNGF